MREPPLGVPGPSLHTTEVVLSAMKQKPKAHVPTAFLVLPNFHSCLYLRNRKHVPCFYRVIQARVEIWENEKCCGNTSHRRRVFPQLFRVLPNFHECLYNSIETRSTCFLFLLENTTTRKRKQLVNFDYQNVNSLCSRHHYVNSAR